MSTRAEQLIESYVSEELGISTEEMQRLEALCLRLLREYYDSWRSRPHRPEPIVTTDLLWDDINQHGGLPENWKWVGKSKQVQWVRSCLERLHRKGLVKYSWAVGSRSKEARAWEPV